MILQPGIIWTIVTLLFLFFALTSSIKIFAWQKTIFETQMGFMRSYGLNRQMFFLIGVVELAGAIAIWFQQQIPGLLGAGALLCVSIGAIGFHLVFDNWKSAVPATVTTMLSGLLVYNQQSLIPFI